MRGRSRNGFTLLEMMAVVVLMGIVLGVAIDFYLDLSRASFAATTQTGDARRAIVLLDRVARDLEGAVLLQKPPETDPNEWPWLFLAESESPDAGADRVKLVRRGRAPRSSDLAESDLEQVAWMAAADADGSIELRRATWPQLADKLDRTFPDVERSDLVSAGIASFGIRFEGENGEWTGRWDSSQLAESSSLPIAAEIAVSYLTDREGVVDGPYTRKVLFPLRPLDLAKKLAEAQGLAGAEQVEVQDENGDGVIDQQDRAIAEERAAAKKKNGETGDEAGARITLAECMARSPAVNQTVQGILSAGGQMADIVQSMLSLPVAQAAQVAGVGIPEECQ